MKAFFLLEFFIFVLDQFPPVSVPHLHSANCMIVFHQKIDFALFASTPFLI